MNYKNDVLLYTCHTDLVWNDDGGLTYMYIGDALWGGL